MVGGREKEETCDGLTSWGSNTCSHLMLQRLGCAQLDGSFSLSGLQTSPYFLWIEINLIDTMGIFLEIQFATLF